MGVLRAFRFRSRTSSPISTAGGRDKAILSRPERKKMCVEILSGVFQGLTLGTPISIMVQNTDARPEAYKEMETMYRPSHADFTYQAKYGIRNWQGGGRASARETIGRVAAGAVAKKLLNNLFPGIEILAYVTSIHDIEAEVNPETVTSREVEANVVRCPDTVAATKMIERIKQVRSEGDSVGGVLEGVIRRAPPGLGEPVFDKLEADLAKAMLSLPATKGFEIGSGFAGSRLKGSEHNDAFRMKGTRVRTLTNFSGGIQGGISNGEPLVFRVAFKPTATIAKPQQTVTVSGENTELAAQRAPRPVRPPACGAHGRGHGGSGALRSCPAPARTGLPAPVAHGRITLLANGLPLCRPRFSHLADLARMACRTLPQRSKPGRNSPVLRAGFSGGGACRSALRGPSLSSGICRRVWSWEVASDCFCSSRSGWSEH